jgi:hypothetical protein
MGSTPEPTAPHMRAAELMILVLGVVAITPLLVTVIVVHHTGGWMVTGGALGWIVLVCAYHALLVSRARDRRNRLRQVIDETQQARSIACDSFQDRLDDQQAILGRIITLSQQIVADGITDPQVTLDNVRHLEAHARDGQALIEDTIAELRVENSSNPVVPTDVDVRDAVEEVAVRFPRAGIVTAGARHFARTDRVLLPVVLRNLVAAALERGAAQIDMCVARDGSVVMVTVSDDGPESVSVPRLPAAIAEALDSTIVVTRRMNRNHFSVVLPAAGPPPETADPAPLDVLGSRSTALPATEPDTKHRKPAGRGRIVFPEPAARDHSQTVAARRKDDVIAR